MDSQQLMQQGGHDEREQNHQIRKMGTDLEETTVHKRQPRKRLRILTVIPEQ